MKYERYNLFSIMHSYIRTSLIQRWIALALVLLIAKVSVSQDVPDIRSVTADLEMPTMVEATPSAGVRTKRQLADQTGKSTYHSLYLPRDWDAKKQWPILVELPGNGGYRSPLGDECTGRPEDACMGYGLSAGEGFLWLSCPFLNEKGDDIAITWWGDHPTYNPKPTINYLSAAIDDACKNFGGDPSRVILCGFSRGAIACNYIGLHDDEIAKRWRAFVVYSHYDGVRKWPYSATDRESAAVRFMRLGDRPQFICGEGNQIKATETYLQSIHGPKRLTFASTGFRNHSDRWTLRPSPTRELLRRWLQQFVRS